MRVINLGLPKTGTTTLAKALRRGGFKTADWRVRTAQTEDESLHEELVGRVLYEDYFKSGNPLARLAGFDAITEMSALSPPHNLWPQCDWAMLSAIREHAPGVKFLFSWRDPEKTVDSMMRWRALGTRRLPKHDVPGLPRGYWRDTGHLVRWVEGHARFLRHVFRDDPGFLEYDIENPNARDLISGFLETELPWWGRNNVNHKDRAPEPAAED